MKKIWLILNILLFDVLLLSQNFSGNWINYCFKKKLTSGFTPYESTSKQSTISALYFPDCGDSVKIIYNFHETNWYKYIFVNDKCIETVKKHPFDKTKYRIWCDKIHEDSNLFLFTGNDTMCFSFYNQEFPSLIIPLELVNKKWLFGEYYYQKNKSYVKFQINGEIFGLNNYTTYQVAYDFQGPPDYDYIKFYYDNNLSKYDIYSWSFNNDTLVLSQIYIDKSFNFTIDTTQILLIKKN
ncbi:hypothetical protein KKA87_07995 [bacterium]|nr:hypothetical protein [bacterium]MBU1874566.1 hypothetical protein [bacterium]